MPEPSGHIQDYTPLPYLRKLGTNLLDTVVRRFSNPATARRNRFILLFVTSLVLTLILLPSQHLSTTLYQPGDIAASDIRATQDYLLEDKELTRELRAKAELTTPQVYTFNDQLPTELVRVISRILPLLQNTKGKQAGQQEALLQIIDAQLSDAELGALGRIRNNKSLLADLEHQLTTIYRSRIVLDAKVFLADTRRGIELQDVKGVAIGRVDQNTPFLDIAVARKTIQNGRLSGAASSTDARTILHLAARIMKPNLYFNQEASETLKKSVQEGVRPVLYKIQKGEMIVRVGERISQEQAQKLQMIYQADHGQVTFAIGLGIFGLVLLLFYFPYRFACKNIRKFNPTNRDILAMALLIVVNLSLFKLALLVSANIGAAFPTVAVGSYYYLFPFAAGAMMVRILLNSEVALVYCAMMAPLLGILFNSNMFVMVYALLGSVVGAHGVRQCQNRSVIYTAGLKVMVVNLAMGLCFQTMDGALFSLQTLYVAAFAVIGALLSSMLVSAFTPLFETLFHYTTNIKLLELANLNSPLLRDLMVKAPGTYHHSVVVGNLVEAAAEAIGANPLLARVAAYYHDIGKIAKPLYFIENMQGGENRHDKLSPHMSALILISHVKEGEALAREKRLGQPIIDIIRQHHGTTLIRFFFEKAKNQHDDNDSPLDEQEFHYPGPKPQTREAGLVMLADAVEAASRTLVNPTPDRIQGMVQKLINRIFSDGQLDECELTLKNLHEIAKSFNRILCAIFHHRIDYPEPVHKGANGGKKSHADSGKEPSDKAPGAAAPAQKGSSDDLKRLGMS